MPNNCNTKPISDMVGPLGCAILSHNDGRDKPLTAFRNSLSLTHLKDVEHGPRTYPFAVASSHAAPVTAAER